MGGASAPPASIQAKIPEVADGWYHRVNSAGTIDDLGDRVRPDHAASDHELADGGTGTSFAALLRRHRHDAELTQEALAERAGLSARAISDLERGLKRAPHEWTIDILADALQLSDEDRVAFRQAVQRKRSLPIEAPAPVLRLPAEPTPFIGREREEGQALRLLRWGELRLLTLARPGGVGKTRLAMRVAARIAGEFADGAVFVSLTPADSAERVIAVIANAVGVQERRDRPMLAIVQDHLAQRGLLLVLDNFEHVLEAAPTIGDLLAVAPGLRVLATSRERLHLRSEQELDVPPLEIPPETTRSGAPALLRYPALALFMERARAALPEFEVDEDGARIVADICRRLDGLPLAIELAAAHVRHASLAELLARLNHRLPVLTGGPRDLPLRQQTMRNTISWSYELLEGAEREALRWLAVFAGGWDSEAGTTVLLDKARLSTAAQAPHLIQALVDKSLVRRTAEQTEARYTMLEVLREFGLEELSSHGESGSAGRAHAKYFLSLARSARQGRTAPERPQWVARLELEHDNLRVALRFFRDGGDLPGATELAGLLCWFWETRGHILEGEAWVEELLNAGGDTVPAAARAPALLGASRFAAERGDRDRAILRGEQALVAFRQAGDEPGVALALNNLGGLAHRTNFEAAAAYFEESLTLYQYLGDGFGMTQVLMNSGVAAAVRGDLDQARNLYEQALAICREREDRWHESMILLNLAELGERCEQFERASELNNQCIALKRELGDNLGLAIAQSNLGAELRMLGRPKEAVETMREALRYFKDEGIPIRAVSSIGGLSLLAHDLGQHERAAVLSGAFHVHAAHLGLSQQISPVVQTLLDQILVAARAELGESALEAALSCGRALTVDEAAELALRDGC